MSYFSNKPDPLTLQVQPAEPERIDGLTEDNAQRLMFLGKWHQYDSDTLRCRHGYLNTKRCPGCHGNDNIPWAPC